MSIAASLRSFRSTISTILAKPNPRFRKIIKWFWRTGIALTALFIIYIYCVIWNPFNLFGSMPSFTDIENPKQDFSTEVISSDGVTLGRIFVHNRSGVTYDELPPMLVKTLVTSEDHRFYDHSGLDFTAYFRVLKGLLTLNRQGGGSTLTQQTAKNLFETRGPEMKGKIGELFHTADLVISKTKEWIIAVRLERNFTKEEIIALYLNTVPFNNNAYGIKVAAETYFQKPLNDLNQQECALLVGMLQGTVRFDPTKFPERAKQKRNDVLIKLYEHNYITSRKALDSLRAKPLDLNFFVQNHNRGPAPYFRSMVQAELTSWARKKGIDLDQAGLKIYTTIDSRMQAYAEQAVTAHMSKLQKEFEKDWEGKNPWVGNDGVEIKDFLQRKIAQTDDYREIVSLYGHDKDSVAMKVNERKPRNYFTWEGRKRKEMTLKELVALQSRYLHCGMMSMDPKTGEIKAWVGGIDHTFFKYDHVRQGSRQPGSTFKPFVYGLAMENGFSPCQKKRDDSPTITVNGTPYRVKNSGGGYGDGEEYTLRRALAKSLNSITMQLMQELQPSNVADFAKRMGVSTKLDPVYSLGLGTSDVTLYDMVGAYSTFVNEGVHTKPYYITRIEDRNGNVLENFAPARSQVISAETAYKIVYLLRGGVEEEGGSSRVISDEVKSENQVGGKTGTTDDGSDGWYIGITPDLVTGVWVGGDERSIHFPRWGEGSGGKTALPIWDKYMREVYKHPEVNYRKGFFKQPANLDMELDCSLHEVPEDPDAEP